MYYFRHGQQLIVLLYAGDKSIQSTDIEIAQELAQLWKKGNADE